MHHPTTIPRDNTPPGQKHATRGNNAPKTALIVAEWQKCPTSRSLAIAVACIQCKVTPAQIRACTENICGLFRLRPFQRDVHPAGAPPGKGHFEEPDGLTPGEGDSDE